VEITGGMSVRLNREIRAVRPVFAIYVAAGLTLFCALLAAGVHTYHAYATRDAITSLGPQGDDLARLEGIVKDDFETAGWSLALAATQVVIIVGAGRLKRQTPS
jgi:hypothetical protein